MQTSTIYFKIKYYRQRTLTVFSFICQCHCYIILLRVLFVFHIKIGKKFEPTPKKQELRHIFLAFALVEAVLQVFFKMMFTKAIPLYHYTVTGSRLPHCTISIHVRLYAQLTDKIVLNFVRGRSIAEKQAVNLVVIYIFSCLKSILRMGFDYDMIDACFFINRKFH